MECFSRLRFLCQSLEFDSANFCTHAFTAFIYLKAIKIQNFNLATFQFQDFKV